MYVTVLRLFCFRLKVSINFHDCPKAEKRKEAKKKKQNINLKGISFVLHQC